jgi:glutathione S-transferase
MDKKPTPELEMEAALYYRETCPYSSKVREFIRENGLMPKIKFHDVDDDEEESLETLVEMNDDDQVPCLVVDGEPMLESEAIISWLDENADQLQ